MAELPLLMNSAMVAATYDGRKRVTRRPVVPMRGAQSKWLTRELIGKVSHGEMKGGGWQMHHPSAGQIVDGVRIAADSPLGWIRAPYLPGDRVYVRESTLDVESHGYKGPYYAVLDERTREILEWGLRPGPDDYCEVAPEDLKWRPSIHMPKEYARLWLPIVDVRVERVQDITEVEAALEGVDPFPDTSPDEQVIPGPGFNGAVMKNQRHRFAFYVLWDSINGEGSWDANPFVWVVEFKVLGSEGVSRG